MQNMYGSAPKEGKKWNVYMKKKPCGVRVVIFKKVIENLFTRSEHQLNKKEKNVFGNA